MKDFILFKKCKKKIFFQMPSHQTDVNGFKSDLFLLPFGPLESMVVNFTCYLSLGFYLNIRFIKEKLQCRSDVQYLKVCNIFFRRMNASIIYASKNCFLMDNHCKVLNLFSHLLKKHKYSELYSVW